jgi:Kef-type K+ transport system membrane component KefB
MPSALHLPCAAERCAPPARRVTPESGPPARLVAVMGPAGLAQGFGLVMHFLCAGPTLVGEILAGFTLGPMMLDQVTQVEELQVLGQIALMVVLFERGLYTNFASIAQCGAFGALMAILGCTLSMLLVVVALRINKVPFIESMCGGCIMSASVVGVVDIGWSRRQVKDINPCSSLVGKVIDAGTTFSAIFMLATVTVLRNIDPQSKWYHPVTEWWVVCQPMLFSLAFFVGSSFLRVLYSFFCLKDVMGRFFPPKNDPVSELYNAFEFAQVSGPSCAA